MYGAYSQYRLAAFILLLFTNCNNQPKQDIVTEQALSSQTGAKVGGPCETCELIQIGIPDNLNAIDTSSGWELPGPKLMLTGTVYKPDKSTPAPDIILYYWQTDHKGEYTVTPDLDPAVRRHGHIRGWVKTDKNGRYRIYTNRPAPYPGRDSPEHIHMLVKEPQLANEYYIDDILFDDDPILTADEKKNQDQKGGSGIVKVRHENGVQKATRDIILGLNITNYPEKE